MRRVRMGSGEPAADREAEADDERDSGNVEGHAVAGGHFFPEEFPSQTAQELIAFFEG